MDDDFVRVTPTPAEVAEYQRKHASARYIRRPAVYRVMCRYCGKRMWGSGMGIGSHRRWHDRHGRLAPRFGTARNVV